MIEFKIETGVPIPPRSFSSPHKGGGTKGALCSLLVGQSIFFEGMTREKASGFVANATKASGFKYATRKIEGGYRVWRIS